MPKQLTSTEGMSPDEVNEALKEGRLNGLLGAPVSPPSDGPKNREWVKKASVEQIAVALACGELDDLLEGTPDADIEANWVKANEGEPDKVQAATDAGLLDELLG